MKKYFLIKSVQRNRRPAEEEGWVTWDYTSIAEVLNKLPIWIDEYNKDKKKNRTIRCEIRSVEDDEAAVIALKGRRTDIAGFIFYLIKTDIYESFSLKEKQYF